MLSTLWQRFGCGGRDRSLDTTAVFLVEKEYFDEARKKKQLQAENTRKQKANTGRNQLAPVKCARVGEMISVRASPRNELGEGMEDESDESAEEVDSGQLAELRVKYTEKLGESGKRGKGLV
jgi:hypothetical protein